MRKRRIRSSTTGLALLAGFTTTLVPAVTMAWACVPQPLLVTVQPKASGPSGSRVTVAALGFDPGRAEIRWNAVDGKLLASPEGPDFSVPVVIPEAADGLYHVVVLGRSPGGEIGNTVAVAFDVTSGDTPTASSATSDQSGDEPAALSTEPTSAARTAVAAGTGAVVALAVMGAAFLVRRRTGPPAAQPD